MEMAQKQLPEAKLNLPGGNGGNEGTVFSRFTLLSQLEVKTPWLFQKLSALPTK